METILYGISVHFGSSFESPVNTPKKENKSSFNGSLEVIDQPGFIRIDDLHPAYQRYNSSCRTVQDETADYWHSRLYIPGTRAGRNNFIFSFLTRVNQPLICGVRGAIVR